MGTEKDTELALDALTYLGWLYNLGLHETARIVYLDFSPIELLGEVIDEKGRKRYGYSGK